MRLLALFLLLSAGPLSAAPLLVAAPPSAEQFAEAQRQAVGGRLFGLAITLAMDSDRDGLWQERGRERHWTAELLAPGAHSLSLHFAAADLPAGAQLRLLSADGQYTQGPYTAADVRDGALWTGLLFGERLRLELTARAGSQPRLVLGDLHYGYRDPLTPSAKSGNCNIDVACSQGAAFGDQIRSTVLLQYRVGSSLVSCSGFLVNNARGDLTPYLLTADHCGIRTSNDQTVQVYWRFQRDSCIQPGSHGHSDPDPSFSQTGAELLARGDTSDFSLLVIGTAGAPRVPDPAFTPFWSGWDVADTPAQQGLGVHHPSGDEKSISFFDDPVRPVTVDVDGRETRAWEVFWDQGTTEQGSSGSALWNQDGRAVGVLSGGLAACSNQSGEDYYGRFNIAWTENPECDRQLRFWLDPDAQGQEQLDGRDLSGSGANPRVPACNGQVVTPTPSPTATPTPAPTSSPVPDSGGGSGALSLWLLAVLGLRRRGGHHQTVTGIGYPAP